MISLFLTVSSLAAICAVAWLLLAQVHATQAAPSLSRARFVRHSIACSACAFFAQMCVLDSFSAITARWPAVLTASCTAALYWLCAWAVVRGRGQAPRAQARIALPVLLLCALFAEGFVFNAKAFASAQWTGTPAATVFTDATTGTDARLTQLHYENIGADVKNLHLNVAAVPSQRKLDALSQPQPAVFAPEELSALPVTVRIFITDSANAQELALAERTVLHSVPASQFLTLHLAAPVQSIRVELDAPWYHSPVVLAQRLNAPVPLRISPLRVLALFLIAVLVWLLRPSSFVFAYPLNFNSKRQRICRVAAGVVCVCALWSAALLNTGFYVNPQPQDAQYQELARSLAAGKVSIGDAPTFLAEMENPYDTAMRDTLSSVHAPTEHVGYRFDVAYFAGKYYVYFGVVPVLLLYLPFLLLTGADMPNLFGTLALLPFWVGGVWMLLARIARPRFLRVSAALYTCVCTIVCLCSSVMFLAKRPDFYALPITMALVFSVWGLYFWSSALERRGTTGAPHAGLLFAGSLCMALVAGCRPQMILYSALVLPLFWRTVFHERALLSRRGSVATAALAVPYVLVAAGLMYYNFIRFGSALEFGAQFNLTVADMTHRGLVFGRTGQGLFQYLFQPPIVTAVFPFVRPLDSTGTYLGYVFNDPPLGGIFVCNPFLWALALIPACRTALRTHKLYATTLTALGVALAVVLANIQLGGVLQRYYSDFGVILFLCAALVALTAAQHTAEQLVAHVTPDGTTACRAAHKLRGALLCVMAASLMYSVLHIFMGDTQALLTMNPARFYTALHAVCFWI